MDADDELKKDSVDDLLRSVCGVGRWLFLFQLSREPFKGTYKSSDSRVISYVSLFSRCFVADELGKALLLELALDMKGSMTRSGQWLCRNP